ncbi:hypothetical protein BH11MYX2_BH11MYX2_26300 [soil metagenome]
MPIPFPRSRIAQLTDYTVRLLEHRKSGTDLAMLGRSLLDAFTDLSNRAGQDHALLELDEEAVLAELVKRLGGAGLDGGGPRGVRPQQCVDCVVGALGLELSDAEVARTELGEDVRSEVLRAITAVVEPDFTLPRLRDKIVADAHARVGEAHQAIFDKLAKDLDERGMRFLRTPRVPLDSLQAANRALADARAMLITRVSETALDRAKAVIARADESAAARIDQPVTAKLTPRDIAIASVIDARVEKTASAIANALLSVVTDLALLAWRAAEKTVRPYAASQNYGVDELVEHPKFWRGTVVKSDGARLEIEFSDGKKTLAQKAK